MSRQILRYFIKQQIVKLLIILEKNFKNQLKFCKTPVMMGEINNILPIYFFHLSSYQQNMSRVAYLCLLASFASISKFILHSVWSSTSFFFYQCGPCPKRFFQEKIKTWSPNYVYSLVHVWFSLLYFNSFFILIFNQIFIQ